MIVPGDEAYDDARAVWNGRVDRFPAAVVRVTSTAQYAALEAEYDPENVLNGNLNVEPTR